MGEQAPMRVYREIHRNSRVASLLLGLLVTLVWPSHAEDKVDFQCLASIELPRFPVSDQPPEVGTIHARVTLDEDGKIAGLSIEGTAQSLKVEVENHLKNRAKYRAGCEGRQIELNFDFRIDPRDTYSPVIHTYFRPPNTFVIATTTAEIWKKKAKEGPSER
jgi:hypothetical protein